MRKKSFLFALCFCKCVFSIETTSLPLVLRGRLISPEEKVVTIVGENLKEIRITNTLSSDLFIFGRADTKPFLYKIKKGITKNYKIKAKEISELYYILGEKKQKLEKYSDIKK